MKTKFISVFLIILLCLSLSACGDAKRPIDCPDTKWTCNVANITFSVSEDCKIKDATMINKNGESIPISLVFTSMDEGKVSITNAEETETYLTGTCTYEKNTLSVFVTDIYNQDLDISSTRLVFERS